MPATAPLPALPRRGFLKRGEPIVVTLKWPLWGRGRDGSFVHVTVLVGEIVDYDEAADLYSLDVHEAMTPKGNKPVQFKAGLVQFPGVNVAGVFVEARRPAAAASA